MTDLRDGSNMQVRARYSQNARTWLLQVKHGANGPEVIFHAKYALGLADQLVDMIENLDEKGATL